MATRAEWKQLSHPERVRVLADESDDQIAAEYRIVGKSDEEFKQALAQERALWIPDKVGKFKAAGKPPTKHSLLGSYRDLERSEALLELIDNSIDVWNARRISSPTSVDKELSIV